MWTNSREEGGLNETESRSSRSISNSSFSTGVRELWHSLPQDSADQEKMKRTRWFSPVSDSARSSIQYFYTVNWDRCRASGLKNLPSYHPRFSFGGSTPSRINSIKEGQLNPNRVVCVFCDLQQTHHTNAIMTTGGTVIWKNHCRDAEVVDK